MLVTIFTPNYNGSKYIAEAIESILNQDFVDFEYIIVDDASTDNSVAIIQEYATKDSRIRFFKNKENFGITKTRNLGFSLRSSKSKYFAILDDDDISLPNRISMQVRFLEKNLSYGMVGSNVIIIDENSKILGYRYYPQKDEDLRKAILKHNPFTQSSVMLRCSSIIEVGNYLLEWNGTEDYDYWLRLGVNFKFANIYEPLVKYRLSSTQIKTKYLKQTINNIYHIQKKAINELDYKDTLLTKLYRQVFNIFRIFPNFMYFFWRRSVINKSSIEKTLKEKNF
ncbi:glycosyltransferase family 2 protein [Candidatus Lokiarchaeum ossiferum]|uniref:glycosyltransferase family 2 protein n=1 Tax=Candidatus Lokiarchaeum ossiferum TaxID=2951803 RepID=UPI00352E8D04